MYLRVSHKARGVPSQGRFLSPELKRREALLKAHRYSRGEWFAGKRRVNRRNIPVTPIMCILDCRAWCAKAPEWVLSSTVYIDPCESNIPRQVSWAERWDVVGSKVCLVAPGLKLLPLLVPPYLNFAGLLGM